MLLCGTGPLAAAGPSKDPDHHACVELFTAMHLAARPMLPPTPIVDELGYLLHARGSARAESAFLESLAAGDFRTIELRRDDYARMAELVDRYADLPLGTSDAAVITLAERLDVTEVATLGRRHFSVVRPRHSAHLILLP